MTSHFSLFIMIGHTDSRRFFLKYTAIIIVSIKLSYYPIILISWRCSKSKQSCFYLHLMNEESIYIRSPPSITIYIFTSWNNSTQTFSALLLQHIRSTCRTNTCLHRSQHCPYSPTFVNLKSLTPLSSHNI